MEISKQQYEYALSRIEELLPMVTDETPANDKNAVELTIVSDVVEAYEKDHYPIIMSICLILGIAPAAMLGI